MKRLAGAFILIVLLALPVIFGPAWVLVVIAAAVVPVCMHELYRIALDKRARVLGIIAQASSLPYMYFAYRADMGACLVVLGLAGCILMLCSLFLYERGGIRANDLVYAIAGLVYPMALIGFWVLIRVSQDGRFWLIFGLVSVFAADSGAYYTGKAIGKRPIAPRLSPKKTVEGFLGGIAGAVVLGYAAYRAYDYISTFVGVDELTRDYPLWILFVISSAIAVLDLAGDLTASLFKREFQVKDLGSLIPGHGGMLDRMDGIIPVGCILYVTLRVLF